MNVSMKKLAWLYCAVLILLSFIAVLSAAEPEKNLQSVLFEGIEVSYLDEGGKGCPAGGLYPCHWACSVGFLAIPGSALRDRYRVIAIDLPGSASGKPWRQAVHPAVLRPCREGRIDHAGIKRPVLAGHSMGYGIASSSPIISARPEASATWTVHFSGFPTIPGRSRPGRRR